MLSAANRTRLFQTFANLSSQEMTNKLHNSDQYSIVLSAKQCPGAKDQNNLLKVKTFRGAH